MISYLEIELVKSSRRLVTVLLIASAIFVLIPNVSWAADNAATLYQAKCAACHGVDGHASSAIAKKQNVPSFAEQKVQKAANAELEEVILSGGKQKKASHVYAGKGISKEDAAGLAMYVKGLGKK